MRVRNTTNVFRPTSVDPPLRQPAAPTNWLDALHPGSNTEV
jgi:hypothetical protein